MTDNEEWVEDNFDKVLHGRSRDQNARDAACGRGAYSALPWSFGYRELGQPAKTLQRKFFDSRKLHGRLIEDQGA
jgi:hypothetical protein